MGSLDSILPVLPAEDAAPFAVLTVLDFDLLLEFGQGGTSLREFSTFVQDAEFLLNSR